MTTEVIDTEAAQERVGRILYPESVNGLTGIPDASPAQPVTRKKRSDAGQPKKLPTEPDEITLKVTIAEARELAIGVGDCNYGLATLIQDQIIAQLQKRLDQLSKQK